MTNFIHLHLHTEYSITDSIVRIPELIKNCIAANMPAIAITDQNNLFGLVKFYQAAITDGIKPIIGVDLLVRIDRTAKEPFRLVLLAQNQLGCSNIFKLISRAYTEGQDLGMPVVLQAWVEELSAGIIVLSGGQEGDIGIALSADNKVLAQQLLAHWLTVFPDRFYIELQRTGKPNEEDYIQAVLDLAEAQQVPVVATNNVRFLAASDFEAHEARVCVNSGHVLIDPKRPRSYSEQQYLRTGTEMIALFADIPTAIANTVEIAKRCNVDLVLGKTFLPIFPVPITTTADDFFAEQAKKGLEQRLAAATLSTEAVLISPKVYTDRLHYEIDVIKQMGFASYFLIVADFIHWAKQNDIPVGPGRGSGAGSLVAYALEITNIDPMIHELLFERFLNPERVSLPDFDIDFCMDGRDRVIDYVINRYGRDKVSQIITYGTMAAKAVVRDVGRVLGHPYGFVDKIAKLIPFELGITLDKALHDEAVLKQRYNDEEDVKTLIDLALKLEGIVRNAGKHAGGVVIAPSMLTDFMPLYCESSGSGVITQFDKDDVETIGLVKFDFLGLRTLTIIKAALQNINMSWRASDVVPVPIDIDSIALDDVATFKLLNSGETTAVFQLESRGMRDLIKRLKPDRFDDVVALVALFRPGPLQSGMVDDFIDRKHGRAKVTYLYPTLEPILRPTYGVILYQEQVMQIAQVLAKYSLGEADLLRRAMGKKKPEEMAKQRAIFLEGAMQNNIDKHVANNIFDLMEKFAGYGFNKSHSVAYALLAYQTAWLKAHYPAEFMAAALSSDMDNTDKVVLLLNDCKQLGLQINPPDINTSDYNFTVKTQNTTTELYPSSLSLSKVARIDQPECIRSYMRTESDVANTAETQTAKGIIIYGLGAIKGLGFAALEHILASRKAQGLYLNLFDLCKRNDGRKLNRRVLEALIRAGALDSIGPHRASMVASLPLAMQLAEQSARNKNSGQIDLFSLDIEAELVENTVEYCLATEWTEEAKLMAEKSVLGFYLSGHPIHKYAAELKSIGVVNIGNLSLDQDRTVIVAGFVTAVRTTTTRNNNRMAIVTLDDSSGSIDVTVFAEPYAIARDILIADSLVVVSGEVNIDGYTGSHRLRATNIMTLEQARGIYSKWLLLKLTTEMVTDNLLTDLAQLCAKYKGTCPVFVTYQNTKAAVKLQLGSNYKVEPKDALLLELRRLVGEDNVSVRY